jgi:hypothetical protein
MSTVQLAACRILRYEYAEPPYLTISQAQNGICYSEFSTDGILKVIRSYDTTSDDRSLYFNISLVVEVEGHVREAISLGKLVCRYDNYESVLVTSSALNLAPDYNVLEVSSLVVHENQQKLVSLSRSTVSSILTLSVDPQYQVNTGQGPYRTVQCPLYVLLKECTSCSTPIANPAK